MTNQIKNIIESKLVTSTAHVFDPQNDNTHFSAVVICDDFANMNLVKQHQAVMNCLKEELKMQVHALQLKTFTPDKWEIEKSNYGF